MFDETGDLVWSATHYVWGAVRAVKMYGGGAGAAPAWSDGGSINGGGTNGAAPAWQGKQGASLAPARERAQAEGAARELICPFRFPGQYEDVETGLNYNRHRYYDALTGQYCSPDPIGLAGGDRPQGYVDRPGSWVDPLGLAAKKWGPHEKGPLGKPNDPDAPAATFRSGTYTEKVLDKPIVVYRAYGGKAKPLGQYFTRDKPVGPRQAQHDSALNPAWGNTATDIHTSTIPAGTRIFEGIAGPQTINGGAGGLLGGGNQIYIPWSTINSTGIK